MKKLMMLAILFLGTTEMVNAQTEPAKTSETKEVKMGKHKKHHKNHKKAAAAMAEPKATEAKK